MQPILHFNQFRKLHVHVHNPIIVDNNAITATDIWEQNEKTVNHIFLNTVAKGIPFNDTQFNLLMDIANQCPLTGGNAVYEARSILAYTGEILEFNDSLLCDSTILAEERGALPPTPQFHSGEEGYRFSAVPNPANDYLNIRYTAPQDATNLTVQLFNATGRAVAEERLAGTEGAQQIDLSRLSAGLYYLRFISNGKLISTQKIVIIH